MCTCVLSVALNCRHWALLCTLSHPSIVTNHQLSRDWPLTLIREGIRLQLSFPNTSCGLRHLYYEDCFSVATSVDFGLHPYYKRQLKYSWTAWGLALQLWISQAHHCQRLLKAGILVFMHNKGENSWKYLPLCAKIITNRANIRPDRKGRHG